MHAYILYIQTTHFLHNSYIYKIHIFISMDFMYQYCMDKVCIFKYPLLCIKYSGHLSCVNVPVVPLSNATCFWCIESLVVVRKASWKAETNR